VHHKKTSLLRTHKARNRATPCRKGSRTIAQPQAAAQAQQQPIIINLVVFDNDC
jgi:hypothetical protein